jgi:AcrR family transcriptional regulator
VTGPDGRLGGAGGKGARTRRAILEAAIARFGRDGYRPTSVADIARDAGVGGTVAYAYFPSKEALFLAAVDEDAAAVIREGVSGVLADPAAPDWRSLLLVTLAEALETHPLARRLLAGLEPDVTERVLDTPALEELRKACAERLRADQLAGVVRADIDPAAIANGIVAIVLALLMSVVQVGSAAAGRYGADIAAVLEAATEPVRPPAPGPRSRTGSSSDRDPPEAADGAGPRR